MNLVIEIEQEEDGRWIAEVPELPGVLAYGNTREEAIARVKALSLRVLADRVENGEAVPEMEDVFSVILQNLTPPMCPKRPKRHSLVI